MVRTGGWLFGNFPVKSDTLGGAKPATPTKLLPQPEASSSKVLVLRCHRRPVHFGERGPCGVPSSARAWLVASDDPLGRYPTGPRRGMRPAWGREDEEGRPSLALAGRSPTSRSR